MKVEKWYPILDCVLYIYLNISLFYIEFVHYTNQQCILYSLGYTLKRIVTECVI